MRRHLIRQVRTPRCLSALALVCVIALALLLPGPASAQQPPAAPALSVQSVDPAHYPQLTTTVSVVDAAGVPVQGLQAAQFHAFDGQTALQVQSVAAAQDGTIPLSVVLVIDTSGSMQGAAMDRAKQAAADFVNALQPNDSVALVAFSDDVRAPAGPGFLTDRNAIGGAISGLQADGATVLYKAVNVAVFNAAQAKNPRRAIVLLTDGQNDTNSDTTTREASLDAATRAGVPFFTIGFGAQPDVAYLRALSDATHGAYASADTASVSAVYASIAQLLRNQYVLTLRDAAAADGAGGTLRVTADAAGAQPSGTAAFTRGAAVVPVVSPVATAAQPASGSGGSGSSSAVLIAIVVIVLAVIAGAGGLFFVRRAREASRQREREQNAGRQSDEPLPPPAPVEADDGPDLSRGRIVSVDGAAGGEAFEFGTVPLRIGWAPDCDVRVPRSDDVAPQHALVWARDGKLMLRHIGGQRHRTTVAGRAVDWLILDDGDEFAVGKQRFRAEHAPAERGRASEPVAPSGAP